MSYQGEDIVHASSKDGGNPSSRAKLTTGQNMNKARVAEAVRGSIHYNIDTPHNICYLG